MDDSIIKLDNLKIFRYIMPGIESNMYLIIENGSALIIDPHVNENALSFMKECGVADVKVLLTHEHVDHISGVNWLRDCFSTEVFATNTARLLLQDPKRNLAKFWNILVMDMPPERMEATMKVADEEYSCCADKYFAEEFSFMWNNHVVHMLAAPGHSPGGMVIFVDDILFSGDNLVNGSGVITRLPGGNWKTYCEKTRPIIEDLPDETWIFPGHGEPARLAGLRKYLNKFGTV